MYFVIAANPGEALKPLSKVASGGISGRTAQRVAEKLCTLSQKRQVICITHLPQIAAMADVHFMIEKAVQDNKTVTSIYRLLDTQCVEELARLLGGSTITEAVRANAQELCHQAAAYKNK